MSGRRDDLGWGAAAVVVGFSVLCGSVSLIYPFGRDQGTYGYAGWVLLEGGMPYVDVMVLKPPMTVILHAVAMAVFGVNTAAIRLLDIAWTAGTALTVAAIALELWNRRDAAIAAGMATPFFYYQIDYWTIAQTDGWMTLPSALAVWAVLRGGRALEQSGSRARFFWMLAGAFAAIAVLFKYTAGLIGIPMLLALWRVGVDADRRVWRGAWAMLVGGLVTLAVCGMWLAAGGAWDAFIGRQLSLDSYLRKGVDLAGPWQTIRWLFTLKHTKTDLAPMVWAPFVFLVPALFSERPNTRIARITWALLIAWWLCALANVVVQRKFFDYHYLPLLAPSSLVTGLGLSALVRSCLQPIARPLVRRSILAGLGIAAIVATPLGHRALELANVGLGRQTMDEYIASRDEYALPPYDVGEIRALARYVADHTRPEQWVYLWGWEPTVYVRARRRGVSRFVANVSVRPPEEKPERAAELMRALEATPPTLFVVGSNDPYPGYTGSSADSARALRDFDELWTFVEERYVPVASIGRYSIYRALSDVEEPTL